MPFTATIAATVRAQTTDGPTGGTTKKDIEFPASLVDYDIASGSGAGLCNLWWRGEYTLTSSNTTVNLTSISANATTNTGAANFTGVKYILIQNNDATNTVTAFASSANSFQAGLSAGASEVIQPVANSVPAKIVKDNWSAAGWATSTTFNLRLVSNANATCTVIIGGIGS